jgi:hypothetical protein
MNSFLPSAKRHKKVTGVMLAIALSGFSVQSVRAEEEEPGPVDRVVNFFKSLDEKKKERERAREAPPVRAVPVEEPPQGTTRARSSSSSGSQSLDTPPSSQSSTKRKPTRTASSKRSTTEQKSRDDEPAVAKSSRETESRESESQESSSKETKPAPDLDAARKELAELKRKVAAMEAQLGQAGGPGDTTAGPAAGTGQSQEGAGSTAPLPAPINPPRNVVSTPAYESKKPFSNGADVTLKVPEQGVTSSGAGAPATTGNNTTPPPAASAPSDAVPIGTKTDKPGIVKSPHAPFNEIDVNGLQKGVLAKDPTTQKIFRVP